VGCRGGSGAHVLIDALIGAHLGEK
jgi:hypothetical protein